MIVLYDGDGQSIEMAAVGTSLSLSLVAQIASIKITKAKG